MQSFKLKLVEQKYQVLAEELYCLLIQKKVRKNRKKIIFKNFEIDPENGVVYPRS